MVGISFLRAEELNKPRLTISAVFYSFYYMNFLETINSSSGLHIRSGKEPGDGDESCGHKRAPWC